MDLLGKQVEKDAEGADKVARPDPGCDGARTGPAVASGLTVPGKTLRCQRRHNALKDLAQKS
jgi:hypothetical protein